MKEEKNIVPMNGYLMLLVFLVLFIGSIYMMISNENPWFILGVVAAIIIAIGFIIVQPNYSKVLLLF